MLVESRDVVEGTWRRMFEVDMREDEMDFSSKALEAEIKELEEEIGDLMGLDEELGDPLGLTTGKRLGSFISLSSLPEEWRQQVEGLKEVSVPDPKN